MTFAKKTLEAKLLSSFEVDFMNFFRILILVFLVYEATGQRTEVVSFEEKSWDFGTIREQGGSVEHEFRFRNTGLDPLTIVNVEASCGCTTPEWTRTPVPPGAQGFVRAQFEPKGRPGYFSKTISITTDRTQNAIVLQIKGNVVDTDRTAREAHNYTAGSLSFTSSIFNVGKVYNNQDTPAKAFSVRNNSNNTIQFHGIVTPAFISIKSPQKLGAQESGQLMVTYDGRKKGGYGFRSDQIIQKTDDPQHPEIHLTVYATLEEFFPKPAGKELDQAPKLTISGADLNLGTQRTGSVVSREILLRNTGKKSLEIRALVPNCTCLTAMVDGPSIAAGGIGKLTLNFSAGERTGRQNKSVLIYSNDPLNPVQRITLTTLISEN